MSRSHSCKGQFYNKDDLLKLLFFLDSQSMDEACDHYGINLTNSGVSFNRASFKTDAPLVSMNQFLSCTIFFFFFCELEY